MSGGMENGPNNHNGEEQHIWERAWSLEEMRRNSASWSLAADSGLFLFLQDFSQRMLSKTHEIEKQLDGLIRDTKVTDSCLHTVFNDFLMLSNTQFIENRVYDEEIEEPAAKSEALDRPPEQEKTREQKEAELIPKVQEAVNYGLGVLDSAFEQLDIKAGNSDSEDEEATDRVEPILEPKDLYVDRPLPYLIGSQLFMEQDDVGLGDLSSEEMSIDSDRDSVIESEEDKCRDQSDEDEGQGSFNKKSSVSSCEDDDDDEDDDLDIFGESGKDENDRKNSAGPASFAEQLEARIKGETPRKSDAERKASTPSTAVKNNKRSKDLPSKDDEEDDNELFKPPKMEDDDDYEAFGGRGGLFSGGRDLFDDEGDLFSDAPREVPDQAKRPSPQTSGGLFGSPDNSESPNDKDHGNSVRHKPSAVQKPVMVGGGLFDDDTEDDYMFSGMTVKNNSHPGQKKSKQTVDLFEADEDDEEGDIFSKSSRHAAPQQNKKEAVEEDEKHSVGKKRPAGAVSMFGPGTKSVLVEALKKRQPSTSEESVKSEESAPPTDIKHPASRAEEKKPQSWGLFSDDEDSQVFPAITKSKTQPEATTQIKADKAPVSLFDDDEDEEDLFSSAPKSKAGQSAAKPVKKPTPGALFSDDEDHWMSPKQNPGKPESKTGGMKPSVSAPSSLPSTKTPQKTSLFDSGDNDDDLFAATKESSQKKTQRVSLLFEDEEEDDKGSLFDIKKPDSSAPCDAKVSAAATLGPLCFDGGKSEDKAPPSALQKPPKPMPPAKQSPEPLPSPQVGGETEKKPAGAVSLFGGIDVLKEKRDMQKTKSPLEDDHDEDIFLGKEAPPPMAAKAKKPTLSLFDDEEEEEPSKINGTSPVATSITQPAKNTLGPEEQRSRTKSTGVFQDEELLFSQKQQMDNDPDVDLFATAAKSTVSQAQLSRSVKPTPPSLFGEDDEDDLFTAAKPKIAPKVPEKPSVPWKQESSVNPVNTAALSENEKSASPVKSKEPSSWIGKIQANLVINPVSLLPGAVPRIPGALSPVPGLAPSPTTTITVSGLLPSPSCPSSQPSQEGVNFDSPAQVATLQSANKGRAKGSVRRRPQTRAARHLAAQHSEEHRGESLIESSAGAAKSSPVTATSLSTVAFTHPSLPSLSTPLEKDSMQTVRPKKTPVPTTFGGDLFGSDDLFASSSKPALSTKPKTKPHDEASLSAPKKEVSPSLFDDPGDNIFQTVKQKATKKASAAPFLEDVEDDDIFSDGKSTISTSKDAHKGSSAVIQNIFKDEIETTPKTSKKLKEKPLDASLFDDNVDIFADLTPSAQPKEKKPKKKVETKSIFDDDMDDIFSPGAPKAVAKPLSKPKKTQPAQESSSAEELGRSIFDDPLNVLGGK
ncbi:WASH complex subunit 2 isoform X3 [Denticeps clupeoides]|uniref:WASH complex subunit 2 isoform X3 n=1 Tax=Denticeps clupeoides TaxID=299321 RepID=UPI0010A599BD|nr:WASH complex subunit 2-like isoform X3 [Denticeps clupeoides]